MQIYSAVSRVSMMFTVAPCFVAIFSMLLEYTVTGLIMCCFYACLINHFLVSISVVLHYNTIQYNTIQYNTIQYNTIQYNTIQYNTIQYNTTQHNTTQHNTTQHNTTQHNTIQYNTSSSSSCCRSRSDKDCFHHLTVAVHLSLCCESDVHESIFMSLIFRFLLMVSLNRRRGRPLFL